MVHAAVFIIVAFIFLIIIGAIIATLYYLSHRNTTPSYKLSMNTDVTGCDIGSAIPGQITDAATVEKTCNNTPGCQGFVFWDGNFYLKSCVNPVSSTGRNLYVKG